MSSLLAEVLQKHGMRAESQLLDSNRSAFPPFTIQLHGITDAPYFSGSTRVRVFLAHPAQGTSLLREDQRDSTTNTTDDDNAVSLSRYVEVFSALHPEGNHADAQAMGETNLPVLDAVQADAAECCAPWFSGSGSFAFVDGNIMCHPDHPIKASVVAVALVDIIDRRTSMSIGCVGGCTIHLNGRNGVMSYSIRRKVRVRQQPNSDGSSSLWLSISGDALPLTTLVAEVHWGAECSSRPNAVTAKKLRALMFGAIPVEHQVRLGPCLTRSATTSQEDRRRLLYQNSSYRSMRPVDIHLTAETAKVEFDRVNGIASAQGGVVMASWDVIESLGFLVFNLRRGATLTIHGLEEIEPLPVKGVGRSATTHATSNNTVLAPSPSLAHLMLFRVVVEGNDVVVGQTVRHNWDASLLRPSFPSKSNTFRFSEDTMMDDDDDESNHRNHSTPATNAALEDEEDDGTRAFKDLGELRAVTAMVRVFAMVPNYRKLKAEAATSSGGANNQRSSSSSASLLSRFGFDHFEPMNPTHYQVIPYAWGVVDIVAPDQPFIKCKQFEPLTLYRGKPTSEVLQALQPLLRATTTTATLRRKTKHLHDVMKQLKDDKLLPAQAMRTRLSISVNDASMHVSHPDSGGGGRGAGDAGDDELQHDRLSLQRGWLGLSRRDVTIPQVEECLEATFRAFVFE